MNLHYIRIGKQERPISFGYGVAYTYEVTTGKSYNGLVRKVSQMLMQSTGTEDANIEDAARALDSFQIVPFVDLIYHGLLHAHRKEKLPVTFDASDVAEWLFEDQECMQKCMLLFFESLPRPDGEEPGEGDAKKKKVTKKQSGTR